MSDDIHPNSFAATLAANRGLVRLNEVTEARAITAETALAAERAKVARLVEALAYYADAKTYEPDKTYANQPWPIFDDEGALARAALASVQGEVAEPKHIRDMTSREVGEHLFPHRKRKAAPEFPPAHCTAWEDCWHDGVCHDADCGAIGPNDAREEGEG